MLPVHTILHPTDFSEQSENALRLACARARDYHARLVLLHVVSPPALAYGVDILYAVPEPTHAEERQRLDSILTPDVGSTERRLVEGDAPTEILRVAEESHCDLIVMGTYGRTGLARLLMGSVAEQVVRRALCPVLTVKTPFPARVAEGSAPSEELVNA